MFCYAMEEELNPIVCIKNILNDLFIIPIGHIILLTKRFFIPILF